MRHSLFLAWKALWWYRSRSVTILLSLAVMIWVPVTVRLLLNQFRTEISARASRTPIVLGAKGSRIDLMMHALYFDALPPAETRQSLVTEVTASGLGVAIPIHARYHTQSQPGTDGAVIVGTSPEYFEFRGLTVASGEMMSLLGECILGAAVADAMGLKPGDSIMSAPRNAFDLAGDYPLKMHVTGILARSHSADDHVVFTDVRTAWVIDGIGHGHQELNSQTDSSLLLSGQDSREPGSGEPKSGTHHAVTANAGVLPYTEITEENIDSFHFHGDSSAFPLTAVIVAPKDEKSRVRILGRFATDNATAQCLKPPEVIEELLGMVFRIEQLVWVCSVAAGLVTLLLLGLIISLSLRLRTGEMQTLFRIGCSQRTIATLQTTEVLILVLSAVALAITASWLTSLAGADSLRTLLF